MQFSIVWTNRSWSPRIEPAAANCHVVQRLASCSTFTNCATCFMAAPYTTRCSCIRVDFQNASFLPLKTRTNSSIMCTSRDSWGKTIETLLLFSLKSPIPRIGILCKKSLIQYAKMFNNLCSPLVFQILLEAIQKLSMVGIWANYPGGNLNKIL